MRNRRPPLEFNAYFSANAQMSVPFANWFIDAFITGKEIDLDMMQFIIGINQ